MITAPQVELAGSAESPAGDAGLGRPQATPPAKDSAGNEPSPREHSPLAVEQTPLARTVAENSGNIEIPDDMEATIILRPRHQPAAVTKVIVINNVSNRFRRYLLGEVDRRPVETGLRVCGSSNEQHAAPSARVALLSRVFDNRRHPKAMALADH
jgi:hypothetical protein